MPFLEILCNTKTIGIEVGQPVHGITISLCYAFFVPVHGLAIVLPHAISLCIHGSQGILRWRIALGGRLFGPLECLLRPVCQLFILGQDLGQGILGHGVSSFCRPGIPLPRLGGILLYAKPLIIGISHIVLGRNIVVFCRFQQPLKAFLFIFFQVFPRHVGRTQFILCTSIPQLRRLADICQTFLAVQTLTSCRVQHGKFINRLGALVLHGFAKPFDGFTNVFFHPQAISVQTSQGQLCHDMIPGRRFLEQGRRFRKVFLPLSHQQQCQCILGLSISLCRGLRQPFLGSLYIQRPAFSLEISDTQIVLRLVMP